MVIPIMIEPIVANGSTVMRAQPIACCAEGATKEEALGNLKEQIESRVRSGGELATLELETPLNPWIAMSGILKDNPLVDEWLEAIAENRRRDNEESGIQ